MIDVTSQSGSIATKWLLRYTINKIYSCSIATKWLPRYNEFNLYFAFCFIGSNRVFGMTFRPITNAVAAAPWSLTYGPAIGFHEAGFLHDEHIGTQAISAQETTIILVKD